jgi:pyruvate dehydrogenase E2 component (dihydrolipoamide acetyltransferase)
MSTTREIRLPALSATMTEAVLLEWKVAVGDTVKQGQPIAEVSTDKVDMDLEAPFDGVIETLDAEPGATIELGGLMATAGTESEDLLGGLELGASPAEAAPPEAALSETVPSETPPGAEAQSGIVPASPPARKMARELGVDLAAVTPSGARGQVTPLDVKRHAEETGQTRTPATQAPAAPTVATEQPAPPAPSTPMQTSPTQAPAQDDAKRLAVRRATVDVMNRSAAVPQFTLYRTLNLDRAAGRKAGRSWTTELVRALAAALREHPELNARWDEESRTTVTFPTVAVGLAVDRPGVGLVVATIADPDLGDPDDADRNVRTVADRAKTGKFRPEDMAQASITLSNLGGLGVDRFNALLFPPQAAIMSAGAIRMRPVATSDGALKAALTCEVGLTVDHRVADGADGARFLDDFAHRVETAV